MHKEISALDGSRWKPLEAFPEDSVSAIFPGKNLISLLFLAVRPPALCSGWSAGLVLGLAAICPITVAVSAGTPSDLAFPAGRRRKGQFPVCIQGIEDANGLLDQGLGIEAPPGIL